MFAELASSINNDISALELVIERAGILMDYEYEQYRIECTENELKTITEAEVGLDHPEGQATDGIYGKAVKIIKKLIESLKAAIKAIYTKIRTTISDIKVQNAMKKAEKVAKENGKLKNKTVKVRDPQGELKTIRQYRDFLNSRLAKIKAGKADGVSEDIDRESESYNKKLSAAKIAAVTTVTVAAAVALIKTWSNHVSEKAEDTLVKTAEIKEDFKDKSSAAVNAVVKVERELVKAAKDEASAISKAITEALSAIRDGVVASREVPTNDTSAKDTIKKAMESADDTIEDTAIESTEDISDLVDSIIAEADSNIADNNTEELVDTFEKTVSTVIDNDNFDPERFLSLYENAIAVEDEPLNVDTELESYDDSKSVAEFLVNQALN